MKRKLDMLVFLKTGTIHDVTVGHTRQEIHEQLGRPDAHSPQDNIWQWSIWTYGGLEFHFTPDDGVHRLWLIWSDHLPMRAPDHSSVALYPWRLGAQPIVWAEEIMAGLAHEGIHFTRSEGMPFEPMNVGRLNLDSGVELGLGAHRNREVITHVSLKWS